MRRGGRCRFVLIVEEGGEKEGKVDLHAGSDSWLDRWR